ncbi:MAG: hypothetical protein WCD53_20140 [Microcoleus sp.]
MSDITQRTIALKYKKDQKGRSSLNPNQHSSAFISVYPPPSAVKNPKVINKGDI